MSIVPGYPTGPAINSFADGTRVEEFLNAYEAQPLNDDERFALMALIIASYDDWLEEGNEDPALLERLRRHLLERFDLHGYTVQYWSFPDEDDPENVFAATGLARQVMAAVFGPRERWSHVPFAFKRVIDWPETGATDESLDWMEIADERDGSFSLSWSKYRERDAGKARFGTIEEAMAHAEREFGIGRRQWADV